MKYVKKPISKDITLKSITLKSVKTEKVTARNHRVTSALDILMGMTRLNTEVIK